jgi:cytochrome P450 family 150 subfamily A5
MTEADIDAVNYFRDKRTILEPYEYLEFLAERRPVYREPHYGVYLVTGYEEALEVFRDTATFSSANLLNGPVLKFSEDFAPGDDITEFVERHRHELPHSDQIVTFDPPRHTDHRAMIMGLITPKRLKDNEEFMWRLADRQLDVVLPLRTVEFIDAYAQPYTLLVIADLLGVPEEDHPQLLRQMGMDAPAGRRLSIHHTLDAHYDYFTERIKERRANPGGDVLTGMAQATFPDGTVPEPLDVARIAANLFEAGQETTVRLLGTTLRRIGDDPGLQRVLRQDRQLIGKFIEETLRFEGPIKGAFRLARKKTTLGGVEIPAGSTVMLTNAAANRDARQFEEPSRFRIERPNVRRHVAFGHGVHTCPGAPLARSEVRVTIERLFDRTSDITISEEAHGPAGNRRWDYMPTYMFRGLQSLTLEFLAKR